MEPGARPGLGRKAFWESARPVEISTVPLPPALGHFCLLHLLLQVCLLLSTSF
jgi:hypothetical protein